MSPYATKGFLRKRFCAFDAAPSLDTTTRPYRWAIVVSSYTTKGFMHKRLCTFYAAPSLDTATRPYRRAEPGAIMPGIDDGLARPVLYGRPPYLILYQTQAGCARLCFFKAFTPAKRGYAVFYAGL